MKEALFYRFDSTGLVQCELCPHGCKLKDKMIGRCSTYQSWNQKLFNMRYGQIASLCMDPIEKKPLYHFYPGTKILSAGFFGCNLSCLFCQNHSLSFSKGQTQEVEITDLIQTAKTNHSLGIAFTYNEPVTMFEYVLDTFKLCQEEQLKTVLVTNGYICQEPLLKILPFVDAMNIDLKSMKDSFYQKMCNGKLQPVLETIKTCYNKCHIEITNLVIPGENDTTEDFENLSSFLGELNPGIPVHLNRYFPHYKLTLAPTPIDTLKKGLEIVSQKMKHVYIGNVSRSEL